METPDTDEPDTDAPDTDRILAEMLVAGLFFVFDTVDPLVQGDKEQPGTIKLMLNCNDLWCWACADSMPVTIEDLPGLYEEFRADNKWGASKWACAKANVRPQPLLELEMKAAGVWDEKMERLPERPPLKSRSQVSPSQVSQASPSPENPASPS